MYSDYPLNIFLWKLETSFRKFSAAKIRNIRVRKEDSFYWIVMDEETEDNSLMEKGVWLEVEFKFISPKDCAGLFALMMTFAENESRDHMWVSIFKLPSELKSDLQNSTSKFLFNAQ